MDHKDMEVAMLRAALQKVLACDEDGVFGDEGNGPITYRDIARAALEAPRHVGRADFGKIIDANSITVDVDDLRKGGR